MVKRWLLISFLLLVVLISGCNNTAGDLVDQTNSAADNATHKLTVSELKIQNYTSGIFQIEGFIVKIYACPPCPSGAMCKPCMRDNIVISESNKGFGDYLLSNTEMIIFTNITSQFELGKKYLFSINITHAKSTGDSLNDIELIRYNPME